jgi:ligand-binding SRPBCC domain-containing protein
MADYVLERRFWLRTRRSEVFSFFADPSNLERVSPRWARPGWVEPPPALDAGAVLDFRAGPPGLRSRWRVMIREFDPPYRFVAVQLWGPFSKWEERHRFEEAPEVHGGAGPLGTWVEERATYLLPLGPVGRLAHAVVVRRLLVRLFDHREARLREMLGG